MNRLAAKQIDAMCQSEHQSLQAINKKFGIEIKKPYSTAMGEPVRLLVMTEKMYNADYTYDASLEHIDSTNDFMNRYRVDFPRPRDPASADFNALKRELGQLVMAELQRHSHDEMKLAVGD